VLCCDSTRIGELTWISIKNWVKPCLRIKNRYNNAVRAAISNCRTVFDLVKERQEIKK
jgi:hypothetical protein